MRFSNTAITRILGRKWNYRLEKEMSEIEQLSITFTSLKILTLTLLGFMLTEISLRF